MDLNQNPTLGEELSLNAPVLAQEVFSTISEKTYADINIIKPTTVEVVTEELVVGTQSTLDFVLEPIIATMPAVLVLSSDTSIAIVTSENEIKAVAPGKVTLSVYGVDGVLLVEKEINIVTTATPATLTAITVVPEKLVQVVDEVNKLNAELVPAGAVSKLTWTSSDETIATVDSEGNVTAVAEGSAVISATSVELPEIKGECALSVVTAKVTDISLENNLLSLSVGKTGSVVVTVSPAEACQVVTWVSSDESVATVESTTGEVTAIGVGSANIKVTSVEDESMFAEYLVEVTKTDVTAVTLDQTELTLAVSDTANLIATVSPAEATVKDVTWTSYDTAVATVSEDGTVTALAVGQSTIAAVSVDNTEIGATCIVTVA